MICSCFYSLWFCRGHVATHLFPGNSGDGWGNTHDHSLHCGCRDISPTTARKIRGNPFISIRTGKRPGTGSGRIYHRFCGLEMGVFHQHTGWSGCHLPSPLVLPTHGRCVKGKNNRLQGNNHVNSIIKFHVPGLNLH